MHQYFSQTIATLLNQSDGRSLPPGSDNIDAFPQPERRLNDTLNGMLNRELTLLKTVLSFVPDLVYVIDMVHSRSIYSNSRGFLGYSPQEMKSTNSLLFAVHPDDRQRLADHFRRDRIRYPNSSIEYRARHKQGHWEWIESFERLLSYDEGQKSRLVMFSVRIITERKRGESTLRQLNSQLQTMVDVAYNMNQSLELNHVLDTFLHKLRQVVPFVSASLFVKKGEQLVYIHGIGFSKDFVVPTELWGRINDRLMHHLSTGSDPVIVDDILDDPRWIHVKEQPVIRSWMCIPLMRDRELFGVLNIDHHEPGFYDIQAYKQALSMSQQASIAIYNSQLYNQAQNEIIERAVAEDALQSMLHRTSALYEISALLIRPDDFTSNIRSALEIVRNAIRAESVMLISRHPQSGVIIQDEISGQTTQPLRQKVLDLLDELTEDSPHANAQQMVLLRNPRQTPGSNITQKLKTSGLVEQADSDHQLIAASVTDYGIVCAVCRQTAELFGSDDDEHDVHSVEIRNFMMGYR